MNDSLRRTLIASLPVRIQIHSSVDFPDEGIAKIRGICEKCAFTLTWNYIQEPEFIQVETIMLDQEGQETIISLKDLSQYLS
jgi:hypothetical protein